MIRIVILLIILVFGQNINAQIQFDTSVIVKVSDIGGVSVLEKSISSIDIAKTPVRYFVSPNCYASLPLVFSSKNKTLSNSSQLFNFLQNEKKNDSSTLLIIFYYKSNSAFSNYHVLSGNDKACMAAFKRALKIDTSFMNTLNREVYNLNMKYPILLCKEWQCKTTTLNSIFY
jgi:hypothetical protein